jgi:hypothetical protein
VTLAIEAAQLFDILSIATRNRKIYRRFNPSQTLKTEIEEKYTKKSTIQTILNSSIINDGVVPPHPDSHIHRNIMALHSLHDTNISHHRRQDYLSRDRAP